MISNDRGLVRHIGEVLSIWHQSGVSIDALRDALNDKKIRMTVSFSGGKSSAYMARRLIDEWGGLFEFIFLFANTGQERDETLIFVDQCAHEWNIPVVWVEAVTMHGKRQGATHRVVTFETANRDGGPYEDMIKKYGIPNMSFPHCTRELKLNAMRSYIESIGWEKGTYLTAIGIRNDEQPRIRKDAANVGIVYPMAWLFPTDKQDVNDFWEDQDFTLHLKDYEGNCSWCWKKSDSKLFRLMDERPDIFIFPTTMENKYPMAGANPDNVARVFFRKNRSTEQMFAARAAIGGDLPPMIERPDENGGCSESCDINMEIEA